MIVTSSSFYYPTQASCFTPQQPYRFEGTGTSQYSSAQDQVQQQQQNSQPRPLIPTARRSARGSARPSGYYRQGGAQSQSPLPFLPMPQTITSLALRIVPGSPSRWPDWIVSAINSLSSSGIQLLAFLIIVAEVVETADLLGSSKMQMHQSLLDASPMVVQAVITSITRPTLILPELQSALKCSQAWIYTLRTK
ncbi:hypothetical protein BD769DRAFT_1671096 [Suillus cothurnatus]|nr:hypothetical protein BD769DRAFT_1671084 [Suillus cothurnatus]KAG2122014.1 hypothetical protein BD769DRAFT_1671096 [Suillus cothurnatus]